MNREQGQIRAKFDKFIHSVDSQFSSNSSLPGDRQAQTQIQTCLVADRLKTTR